MNRALANKQSLFVNDPNSYPNSEGQQICYTVYNKHDEIINRLSKDLTATFSFPMRKRHYAR